MSAAAQTDGGHVLVTGGAGFLGRHVVARLLADGHRVLVLDDLSTGRSVNLPRHPSLALVEASVLDGAAVAHAARGASAVWHLAGVVGMVRATRLAAHAHRVAEEGTRRVLEASGAAPAVLFSSSAVYGLHRADPARESVPPDPHDVLQYDGGVPGYATGKLALETLGLLAAARGRRVLIVRPFNVVGCGQASAYGMVLPTFVQRALAGRELVLHGDGLQTRAFSHVGTFVDALFRLAAVQLGGREPAPLPHGVTAGGSEPVFNLGSPAAVSVLELAQLVREECGAGVPLRFRPYADVYPGRVDVAARSPDPARLTAAIGAIDWPALREVVREVLREERANAVSGERAPEDVPRAAP